ncbi:MAG: SCP2 sterol-binding domain-containing protein [Candidatus Thorarchaeota archaeon]
MSKDRILEEFRKLKKAFENPEIKTLFEYYNKTFQFTFPDIDIDAFMQIGNSAIDAIGVGIAETELGITLDSTVFFAILDGTEDPESAYENGKIQTKGDVSELTKLRKLFL